MCNSGIRTDSSGVSNFLWATAGVVHENSAAELLNSHIEGKVTVTFAGAI